MEIFAAIDWISATYPFGYDKSEWLSVVLPAEKNMGVATGARYGYSEAQKYPSGAISQRNYDRRDMGIHVTYSAKAIAKASEEFDCTQSQLLNYLMLGAKITRLDVCIDIFDSGLIISNLYKDAKAGKIKTRSKNISFIESAKVGKEKGSQTMYIGSQNKRKKLLRVYDKGMQLGTDTDIKRFELECRGDIANNAAMKMKSVAASEHGSLIAAMIRGFADFAETEAGQFFLTESVRLSVPKYVKSDTAKWLIGIVAKTLAKESWLDNQLAVDFMERFYEEYEKLDIEFKKKGGGQ